jgi:glycosyltransferase involved in cell wall biosynthesis
MDKPPHPDLSVILPSYRNAALALASSQELAAYLEGHDLTWEIILVDDGGGDFPHEPGEWTTGRGRLSLIRLPENRGKGAAVRSGMLAASGRCRVFTDADLPFELSLFPLAVEYVLGRGFHMVVGDRTLPASRYHLRVDLARQLASFAFSRFANHLVTGGFYDTQCGFKGFRGDVADAIFSRSIIDRFAFDVEVLYLALKYRLDIKRVPVVLRRNETSSVKLARDSSRMIQDVLRIKMHQMAGHYAIEEMSDLLSDDVAADAARLTRDRIRAR